VKKKEEKIVKTRRGRRGAGKNAKKETISQASLSPGGSDESIMGLN